MPNRSIAHWDIDAAEKWGRCDSSVNAVIAAKPTNLYQSQHPIAASILSQACQSPVL
ncbi:MAG: hypothetical protein ACYS9T_02785 [Planctomycetota bacterium]